MHVVIFLVHSFRVSYIRSVYLKLIDVKKNGYEIISFDRYRRRRFGTFEPFQEVKSSLTRNHKWDALIAKKTILVFFTMRRAFCLC